MSNNSTTAYTLILEYIIAHIVTRRTALLVDLASSEHSFPVECHLYDTINPTLPLLWLQCYFVLSLIIMHTYYLFLTTLLAIYSCYNRYAAFSLWPMYYNWYPDVCCRDKAAIVALSQIAQCSVIIVDRTFAPWVTHNGVVRSSLRLSSKLLDYII